MFFINENNGVAAISNKLLMVLPRPFGGRSRAMRFCVLDDGRCYGTVISAPKYILGHFDTLTL